MKEEYYHTKSSVEEYIELAKGINGKEHIIRLTDYLEKGAELLEIGSGPGSDFEILKQLYQTTGSDYSLEFLKHLKKKFPENQILELDAVTLLVDSTYDGIYSNKVLHHLRDEDLQESVSRQTELLRPGGVVCHTFWNGQGDEVFKGMYVNYHNEDELRDLFKSHYDIQILEPYKEFEEKDSLILIATKR